MTTFLPPRHLNVVVPRSSAERGCPCSRVEELTEPLSGCSNHSRLTRSGKTVSVKLDKQFYRRAESLCQKPTCHNSVCKAVWPLASLLGSHQDSTDLSLYFSSETTPLICRRRFWTQQPRKGTGNWRKTPWPQGAEEGNSPEMSALSFRISGRCRGSHPKKPAPCALDFKVERTLNPTPCQILVPPGVS